MTSTKFDPDASLALTQSQRDELAECEAQIEAGLQTFYDVGTALAKIRGARLYKDTHERFEDYCVARWGMSDAHANRQIAAAQVVDVLQSPDEDELITPVGVVPVAESQARELVSLLEKPKRLRAVWRKAVEQTTGRVPTAKKLEEARVSYRTPEEIQQEAQRKADRAAERERRRQAEINEAVIRDRDKRNSGDSETPAGELDLGAPGTAESVQISAVIQPAVESAGPVLTKDSVRKYLCDLRDRSRAEFIELVSAVPALKQLAQLGGENQLLHDEVKRLNKELRAAKWRIERLQVGGSFESQMEHSSASL